MTDLAAIRAGLAANLQTVAGPAQVSMFLTDTPYLPTLQIVGPDDTTANAPNDFGDGEQIVIVVQGLAGSLLDESAQMTLDRWWASTGAYSVQAAIESDRTLDGACDDLAVQGKTGYRVFELPQVGRVVGCEWRVLILT